MYVEDRCSFCIKPKHETKVLIRSGIDKDKFICDECVELFKKQLSDELPELVS